MPVAKRATPVGAPKDPGPRIRSVPAVDRSVAMLNLLGKGQALGVSEIARALGLIPSTCLHILRALAVHNLVAFDATTKRYRLSSGVLSLARNLLRADPFIDAVQPRLNELAATHGLTAIAVSVHGLDHIVVLAISKPDQNLRLHVDVGSRFPALISATGRCVAAFSDEPWQRIEKRFLDVRWEDRPTIAAWRKDLEMVRRKGYAVDDGRYMRGVTVVSAPVFGRDDRVGHALVVVGIKDRIREVGTTTLGTTLANLAGELRHASGP